MFLIPKQTNAKTNFVYDVQLYPNPTNDLVTVRGEDEELSEIHILNELGQDLTGAIQIQREEGRIVIDLSGLSTGIYLIRTVSQTLSVSKL